jgi:serine protease AprX
MRHWILFLCVFSINHTIFAQNNDWQTKIDPLIQARLAKGERTDFIVQLRGEADLSAADALPTKEAKGEYVVQTLISHAQKSQNRFRAYLDAANVTHRDFWVCNAIYTQGDAALVNFLAQQPEVARIDFNTPMSVNLPRQDLDLLGVRGPLGVNWGIARIKADSVWALGFRGQGVVVGGQDTGYDWTHPALQKNYRGYTATLTDHNYSWHDAIHVGNSTGNPCGYDVIQPCDDQQHGTHTMGTIAGDTALGNSIGIAPAARWIAVRNMDRGNGTLASYVEGFQWFIAPTDLANRLPNARLAPHVINNSWYCSTGEGCNSTNFAVMERAVNATRAAGIVVVVSVGNEGGNCSSAIGPPGFFQKSFSIGSTNLTPLGGDTISGFSSRGQITIDSSNRLKPDVSAPGSNILSSVPNRGYAVFSGTSMAGPHVVGAVALMISANPRLAGQVDTIEKILKETCFRMTAAQSCGGVSGMTIPNNTSGFGRIDALAAVRRALQYRGTVGTNEMVAHTMQVQFFPNPFSQQLTLLASGLKKTSVTAVLNIFNLQGQQVLTQNISLDDNAPISIPINGLNEGIYFYQLRTNDGQVSLGKLSKIN